MKIMLTGPNGLLGKEIIARSAARSRLSWQLQWGQTPLQLCVVPVGHAECDIADAVAVKSVVARLQPDAIINCAVIVSVDRCEADQEQCVAVNRDGVRNLLDAMRVVGKPVTFIQISSSEVFGRVQEGEYTINGYTEDDVSAPVSAYQRTKAEAEEMVKNFAAAHPDAINRFFIARAGWLYGHGRPTFVDQFLEKLREPGQLDVIANQWRSPTWTRYFADQLFDLMRGDYESGIYHITNEVDIGEASTFDVINELSNYIGEANVRAELVPVKSEAIFSVPRAPSNVIKNTKLPKLPHWRDALHAYLNETYPRS